jgi:hypothetical protein
MIFPAHQMAPEKVAFILSGPQQKLSVTWLVIHMYSSNPAPVDLQVSLNRASLKRRKTSTRLHGIASHFQDYPLLLQSHLDIRLWFSDRRLEFTTPEESEIRLRIYTNEEQVSVP